MLRGPFTRFPLVGISKRQGCVSHSTPEAEILALAFAMRIVGLLYATLWRTMTPHRLPLVVHEDSMATIRVVHTGKNPTMRYMGRTHRISVAWPHEGYQDPQHKLASEQPINMCADIYTVVFVERHK